MITPFVLFRPRPPSLSTEIYGRELNGVFIEGDSAWLRFSDNSAFVVNLETLAFSRTPARSWKEWISFPGWLRITGVDEHPEEISLTVSGAIYSSRICLKKQGVRWQISFGCGQIF